MISVSFSGKANQQTYTESYFCGENDCTCVQKATETYWCVLDHTGSDYMAQNAYDQKLNSCKAQERNTRIKK